jgi:signal transduction histidine kinase
VTAKVDNEELAVLVHEARSPTAALAALAEALGAEALDPTEARELIELAIVACRSLDRIVSDVTLASVRRESIDVGRIATEAAATMALANARVRVVVAPGLQGLDADPLRLRQALDNLLANAVAHSPAGEEVVVTVSATEGHVLVSVSDRGSGIQPEEQSRIFEAGIRGDVGRPGSGLGLAVARVIVEAHDGTLSVESEPGQGATFTLALPFRP